MMRDGWDLKVFCFGCKDKMIVIDYLWKVV